jgi:hypothetical protein
LYLKIWGGKINCQKRENENDKTMSKIVQFQGVRQSNSKIALRTDGKRVEVAASGDAADFLAGVVGFCLIALTIRAIAR